jgi:hypothetical protein
VSAAPSQMLLGKIIDICSQNHKRTQKMWPDIPIIKETDIEYVTANEISTVRHTLDLFSSLHRAFLRFIYHYTPTNAPNLFTI